MALSAKSWLSAEQGTSRSRVWARMEGAAQRTGWRHRSGSVSPEGSAWHIYRPAERVPESGSGKVPIPLSRVLIWQLDSGQSNRVRVRDGSPKGEKVLALGVVLRKGNPSKEEVLFLVKCFSREWHETDI